MMHSITSFPGTGHWFTEIPDHITYMMVRVDPGKVAPMRMYLRMFANTLRPGPSGVLVHH